ncbi:barstar family protein [Kitasatospora cineracea]|uniref:Barstar (Barnase inhibitor) n=1 Tax=Kitasatospora cineracea TaxID=88074 RepID=A0A3N4RWE6_9ACTN|nr:barstar family protein [Kitasatospora cineracea]RPE32737.1 barstar (barnase inhibitor) [Kitasatospora cineracea]
MQPVDHREWERPFPVRYLVVGEDEDGGELLLGRCAAVEGLFTDPAPPPREVLVLRGCAPGAAAGWLGPAEIVGRTASGFDTWWTLVDAEVLSVAPGADGSALVDVVIGAGVHPADWHRNTDEPFVRFELVTRRGAVRATGRAVAGLAVDRPAADPLPLRLVGCEPAEPMRAALRKRCGPHPGYTELWSLDDTGRVMDRRAIGFDVEWTRPSVLGGALVDVLLTVEADGLPGSAARAVWRQWRAGPPRQAGSWRGSGTAAKETWQTLALYLRGPGPDRSGGEYHLDGREVEDVTGLHCAIGEAVNGPGGYYGREWNGLRDCLGGGFGLVPPFTLVWHDFAVTEEELAADRDPATGLGYPEGVARELERRGVTVVRA